MRLVSNLVLTRLLAPELYGIVAVGYMVTTGLGMFSDLGIGASAMRSTRGDEPIYQNTAWVLQLCRGIVLTVMGALAGYLLSELSRLGVFPTHSVYADPKVPMLVAVICTQAFFDGFASSKAWMARRNLAFKNITIIELTCQLVTTVVMVVWAFVSPTVWTLAGGGIVGSILRSAMTHAFLPGPANRFQWDKEVFLELLHFGKWVFISSGITFFLISGDRLLLGTVLDARELGLYAVAFTLVTSAQTAIMKIVGTAVLPALSEVQRERPTELRQTYYRIRAPLDVICFVTAGAIFVSGEAAVRLLYDARYAEAGWILSVLGLTFVATPYAAFDQCLIAVGRVKFLGALNTIRLALLYCAVPLGYITFGARGAIAGVAVSSFLNAFAVVPFQARLGLLNWRRELLALPLLASGALGAEAILGLLRMIVDHLH